MSRNLTITEKTKSELGFGKDCDCNFKDENGKNYKREVQATWMKDDKYHCAKCVQSCDPFKNANNII